MRNLKRSEALVEAAGRTLGRTLEIKQLDVCDEDSIKACVDSLPQRRVDILSMLHTHLLEVQHSGSDDEVSRFPLSPLSQ